MKYTSEEILEILQADYLQNCQFTMVSKGFEISFGITIEEWRDVCDLLEWEEISAYYNKRFEIHIGKEEWRNAMIPEKIKTLNDICVLISAHAKKEDFTPVKLFGNECLKATVFRKVLKRLKLAGIDTQGHLPSSPLTSMLIKTGVEFIESINLLSPGSLPLVDFEENNWTKFGWKLFGISLLFLFLTILINHWTFVLFSVSLFLSGFAIIRIGNGKPVKKFEFQGIQTYRDLVEKIIENESRRKAA